MGTLADLFHHGVSFCDMDQNLFCKKSHRSSHWNSFADFLVEHEDTYIVSPYTYMTISDRFDITAAHLMALLPTKERREQILLDKELWMLEDGNDITVAEYFIIGNDMRYGTKEEIRDIFCKCMHDKNPECIKDRLFQYNTFDLGGVRRTMSYPTSERLLELSNYLVDFENRALLESAPEEFVNHIRKLTRTVFDIYNDLKIGGDV